jgi:GTP-binding protein HflX
VPVSALTGEGVDGLLATLEATLPHPPVEVELLVPYGREDLIALLYRESEVRSTTHDESGTLVHARVGLRELAAVREFVRREHRTR